MLFPANFLARPDDYLDELQEWMRQAHHLTWQHLDQAAESKNLVVRKPQLIQSISANTESTTTKSTKYRSSNTKILEQKINLNNKTTRV